MHLKKLLACAIFIISSISTSVYIYSIVPTTPKIDNNWHDIQKSNPELVKAAEDYIQALPLIHRLSYSNNTYRKVERYAHDLHTKFNQALPVTINILNPHYQEYNRLIQENKFVDLLDRAIVHAKNQKQKNNLYQAKQKLELFERMLSNDDLSAQEKYNTRIVLDNLLQEIIPPLLQGQAATDMQAKLFSLLNEINQVKSTKINDFMGSKSKLKIQEGRVLNQQMNSLLHNHDITINEKDIEDYTACIQAYPSMLKNPKNQRNYKTWEVVAEKTGNTAVLAMLANIKKS